MRRQVGQIHIILLVLFVVGVILYLNFSDRSFLKFILPSAEQTPRSYAPSTPSTPDVFPSLQPGSGQATPGAPQSPVTPVAPTLPAPPPRDETPPVISNPSHRGDVLLPDISEVVISVSTDEPASCKYSTNPETGRYNSMSWHDGTKRFHVKTITGLANGNSYDFFVRCKDFNNNENTGDVLINFSIKH